MQNEVVVQHTGNIRRRRDCQKFDPQHIPEKRRQTRSEDGIDREHVTGDDSLVLCFSLETGTAIHDDAGLYLTHR